MGTNYEKGVRFEREIIELFKQAGYQVVRAAGSHSPFDFVAIKTTSQNEKRVYFIAGQCKVRRI